MAYLTVDQAQEGMVLSAPVTDRRGRLLIPAGKELSERHVDALRMWGVTHVEVEGDSPAEEVDRDIDPETLSEAERIVSERFAGQKDAHPLLTALFHHAVTAEAATLHAGGTGA
ncbi:MAG: hypothetical protein RJQ04_16310 [Longimicrobiales bacterium]